MSFVIRGLDPLEFSSLYGLSDEALAARGVIRRTADAKPGYPCRITLEDAAPGERVLLLNHESHSAPTPYRSAYAIYVREGAHAAAIFIDQIPPALMGRPIALRLFSADGMLVGADLSLPGDDLGRRLNTHFANEAVASIHAHNAMHGCFAARITRAL